MRDGTYSLYPIAESLCRRGCRHKFGAHNDFDLHLQIRFGSTAFFRVEFSYLHRTSINFNTIISLGGFSSALGLRESDVGDSDTFSVLRVVEENFFDLSNS